MSKKAYLLLFFIGLLVFSANFIFQKTGGYLDSQYYFLGGKALSEGSKAAPVVWNYLDDPQELPHPLFTYWMPLPSILAALSMFIFQSQTFFAGRIFFWILGAFAVPLAAFLAMDIFNSKFTAFISSMLVIFCGLYFKFLTIPESVSIYIVFGALFFFFSEKLLFSPRTHKGLVALVMGVIAGLLHLSRVDGLIFIGLIISALILKLFLSKPLMKEKRIEIINHIFILLAGYMVVMIWLYFRNFQLFGTLLSPASSRALWLTEYNDTFAFPPELLNYAFWFESGLPQKLSQIWDALKLNTGNLMAVQSGLIGIPLIVLSLREHWRSKKLILPLIYFVIIFFLMTIIFSLAGGRGGYIHAMAAIQIYFWILIADGLSRFIQWGINQRDWKLKRSRVMFGSALIIFAFILTAIFYYKGVISDGWDREVAEFQIVESVIETQLNTKENVIMINNPVGYYLATDRWSVVIPNANWENLSNLIERFNVRYIVLDGNLPQQLNDPKIWQEKLELTRLIDLSGGKVLYAVP